MKMRGEAGIWVIQGGKCQCSHNKMIDQVGYTDFRTELGPSQSLSHRGRRVDSLGEINPLSRRFEIDVLNCFLSYIQEKKTSQ